MTKKYFLLYCNFTLTSIESLQEGLIENDMFLGEIKKSVKKLIMKMLIISLPPHNDNDLMSMFNI